MDRLKQILLYNRQFLRLKEQILQYKENIFILLSFIFLIFLFSCETNNIKDGTTTTEYKFETAKFQYIREFTYKNHDYIMFQTPGINAATAGIVHNPDCKYCKSKEN